MVVWPCRDLETKEGGADLVKRTNVNYIHGLAIKTACTYNVNTYITRHIHSMHTEQKDHSNILMQMKNFNHFLK